MIPSATSLHFIDYPVFSISNTIHGRLLALALRNFAYYQQCNFLPRGIVLSYYETRRRIFKHDAGYGGSQCMPDDAK